MPRLVTGTGLRCPHCRHEMCVDTVGLFWGIWRQLWRHLEIRAAKQRGGRVRCGVCGRSWVVRGDRRKCIPLTRDEEKRLRERLKRERMA